MIPRLKPEHEKMATAIYAAVWLLLWLDWTAWRILPGWLLFIGFLPTLYFVALWGSKFTRWRPYFEPIKSAQGLSGKIEAILDLHERVPTVPPLLFRWYSTLIALPIWQFLVFITWLFGARTLSSAITTVGTIALFFIGLAWTVWYVEMKTRDHTVKQASLLERSESVDKPPGVLWALTRFNGRLSRKDFWIGLGVAFAACLATTLPFSHGARFLTLKGFRIPALLCLAVVLVLYIIYLFSLFAIYAKRWHDLGRNGFWVWIQLVPVVGTIYGFVLPAFFKGNPEPNRYGDRPAESPWTSINPLNLSARYYGRDKQKLKQSLLTAAGYGLAFTFSVLLLGSLSGCRELYEMPAGGGEVAQLQQVKVQKVIKKKFVINPFSAILFNPPPIEEVELQLNEATAHTYVVGYGKGTGAGFSGGTNRGEVRFIRLEYNGGDWDQDFGIGADLNLLIEYNVRTQHKVAKKTESRKIRQLANFPKGKSPPMVYMTGQKNISVSKKEHTSPKNTA